MVSKRLAKIGISALTAFFIGTSHLHSEINKTNPIPVNHNIIILPEKQSEKLFDNKGLEAPIDKTQIRYILEKESYDSARDYFDSERVMINDSFLYFNKQTSLLQNPNDFYANRGLSLTKKIAGKTALEYYQESEELAGFRDSYPGRIIKFFGEGIIGYEDGRIISPFSSETEGEPGEAHRTGKGINGGIRINNPEKPELFMTYKRNLEASINPSGVSLVFNNPIGVYGGGDRITTVAALRYDQFKYFQAGLSLGLKINDHLNISIDGTAGYGKTIISNAQSTNFEEKALFALNYVF